MPSERLKAKRASEDLFHSAFLLKDDLVELSDARRRPRFALERLEVIAEDPLSDSTGGR